MALWSEILQFLFHRDAYISVKWHKPSFCVMILIYFAFLLFEYLMSLVYVKAEIFWDFFLYSLCIYFDALKLHKYISSVKDFQTGDSGPAGFKTDN